MAVPYSSSGCGRARDRSEKRAATVRIALASLALFVSAAATPAPVAWAQSALQIVPDGSATLISKDVGAERWAISRNRDGTVTGNVYLSDGSAPRFLWCEPAGKEVGFPDPVSLSCLGADRCERAPCSPEQWAFVAQVDLPASFFLPTGTGWRTLAPLPLGPRQEHPSVAFGSEIFVLGGFDGSANIVDTVEAYAPAQGAWRNDVARLPVAMHHANVAVVGERIYVAGFLRGLAFEPDGRVFAYDPGADAWSERSTMPAGSERGASGVGVIGERIYVAGGLGTEGVSARFGVYDTATDTWDDLPDLPRPLDHLAAAVVGGVFYVLGGRQGDIFAASEAVFAYDPVAREWTRRADMPTPRGGVAGAVVGGRIFVLGGEGNREEGSNGVFDDVEAYDPERDVWEIQPPMALPRHGVGAAALDGRIYVPGGGIRQAFGAVADVDVLTPAR